MLRRGEPALCCEATELTTTLPSRSNLILFIACTSGYTAYLGLSHGGQQSKQRSPSHLFQLILGGHLVPPKPRDSYSLHSESWVSPMSKTSRLGGVQEVSKSDAGMTLMKLLSGSLVEIWNFSCCKYVKSLSCVHGQKLARLRPAREKTKILLRNIKTLPFSWARDWHWECTSL